MRTPPTANLVDYEINSMAVDSVGNKLFAGSGDGLTYIFDLATGQQCGTLVGHRDYIHSVAVLESR